MRPVQRRDSTRESPRAARSGDPTNRVVRVRKRPSIDRFIDVSDEIPPFLTSPDKSAAYALKASVGLSQPPSSPCSNDVGGGFRRRRLIAHSGACCHED